MNKNITWRCHWAVQYNLYFHRILQMKDVCLVRLRDVRYARVYLFKPWIRQWQSQTGMYACFIVENDIWLTLHFYWQWKVRKVLKLVLNQMARNWNNVERACTQLTRFLVSSGQWAVLVGTSIGIASNDCMKVKHFDEFLMWQQRNLNNVDSTQTRCVFQRFQTTMVNRLLLLSCMSDAIFVLNAVLFWHICFVCSYRQSDRFIVLRSH